ncbi:LAFA_0G24014g1_1 [Lachancea sp. 'fantastica']|nr:LAFA_0G24014g1_1 [Lachancea sp. 'fantastica']
MPMKDNHGVDVENSTYVKSNTGESHLSLADRKNALLKSISERKAKLRNDTILAEKREDVCNAIDDVVRLGYTFENLKDSGINAQFLREAFESTGRTVPIAEDIIIDTAEETETEKPKQPDSKHVDHFVTAKLNQKHTTHPTSARPRKNHDMTRVRPKWLANLVIDLTSSEDDSDHELLDRKPTTYASTRASPETQIINVNSEVSRISMRLKIEISRLTHRIRAAQDLPINDALITSLEDKKNTMLDDINGLFDEIAANKKG